MFFFGRPLMRLNHNFENFHIIAHSNNIMQRFEEKLKIITFLYILSHFAVFDNNHYFCFKIKQINQNIK